MIKIGPIIEVILYVNDMDVQVSFYRDNLGLTLSHPQGLDEFRGQMWVTFDTGTCLLALHGGGEGRLGLDSPKVVFEVADVAVARGELLERGVLMAEIRTAAPGILVCDGKDPEGNPFSLESRTPIQR